jgi:hypothetical protein
MSSISPVPGIKLPVSSSKDLPAETLQVVLTPDSLLFENLKLVDFAKDTGAQTLSFKDSDLGDGKLKVVSLYDSLVKAREKSEFLRQKSKARDDIGNPLPFNTTLSVQADKSIPYDIVRKVMYTSAVAGYKSFLFLAQKQPE